MRFLTSILAAAGFIMTTQAAIRGFNYGAQFNNDQAKTLVDFEYEFNAAKSLPGTNGWTSARLYTMIQHGTKNNVIEAIQAAINTNTTLLLGMWASAGQDVFDNEVAALKAALVQFGSAFTDLVEGISVGSEDLYRITSIGIENDSGPGVQPKELIRYICQTRAAIRGTALEKKPIGHVDTWTVYVNASNKELITNLDFIGMDAYPYFQFSMENSIDVAGRVFFDAYQATIGAAQGKPVWVTETGWPVSGLSINQAKPSVGNARIFWQEVVCRLIADKVNLYYYTLQDVQMGIPSPSFGIKPGGDLMTVTPLFDLSCPTEIKPSSSAIVSSSKARSSSSTVVVSTSKASSTMRPSDMASISRSTTSTRSSSGFRLSDIPKPSMIPKNLQGPFEAPNLIIAIDKASPTKVLGNGVTAQLSPNMSTVFVFDVRSEFQGKMCDLVFFVPPVLVFADLAPVKILSPGGINVSRVRTQVASNDISASSIEASGKMGGTLSIDFAAQYNVGREPCAAGQRVAYLVESVEGLAMDFFQMTSPALGLFMIPS